ncbi:MAG: cation-transporting P-type ATPase, partial [Anaerolineaceae bacterium]
MAASSFWSAPVDTVARSLNSSVDGLDTQTAQQALRHYGPNLIQTKEKVTPAALFLRQFKSPIVLILLGATVISAFLQDWTDAVIIFLIVMGSALLSFLQEFNANAAAETLKEQLSF